MPFLTPNSVALVAAGSAGLGAAVARTFAAAGARVVVNYAGNKERAEGLVEELKSIRESVLSKSSLSSSSSSGTHPSSLDSNSISGTNSGPNQAVTFAAIRADMTSRSEIQRLVSETVTLMGRLDVVVSNQGWTRFRDFMNLDDNMDDEDWDLCFRANVKSHLWLMHACKGELEKVEGGGAFVTTASMAGVVPSGSSLAYSVTKAAQIHLVKALAIIAAPNIRVNSVAPGILLTEWGKQFSEEKLKAWTDKAKLGRVPTVEDVADQILLLAQSRSVTGTNSAIDCGWSL